MKSSDSSRLQSALAKSPQIVQKYVQAGQEEMLALQEQQASLELKLMAANNRIKILEKERKPPPAATPEDMQQTARRIAFVLASAGMRIIGANGRPVKKGRAASVSKQKALTSRSTRSRAKTRAPG